MSRNLAHLSSSHNHLPTRSAQTMLFPNFYTAMLLLLLTLMQFNPSFQTCTKNPHSLAIVNKAVLSNLHHFFASTKDSRETHVQLMRDQVLQVVLNNHGMNDVSTKEVSNRTIAKHLSVSRQSVAKHRSNKIPFKKVQPSKKKPGLTKKAFIFKHNALCQLMVKFWLDHSTPSPNKKDVRWKHSNKAGDHVREYNTNIYRTAYTIQCTSGKCQKDQCRCVIVKLCMFVVCACWMV